ncbi:MAG TPA: alpha/beta hydrolase [Luteolibacter sp.]|nr:alpha/beta hydrolase [Luteolibacter sp.]
MKKFLPLLFIAACAANAAEPIVVKLWPNGAPEPEGFVKPAEREIPPKDEKDVKRVTDVTDPTISIYKPEKPNGTAVIVAPGGGYNILAIQHEGTQVCEWLNTMGVTGVLLKYRVPDRKGTKQGEIPLQDAQRAMGIVRHRAAEWGIKPDKIGFLGFSAGGHLCVMTTLHANERTYQRDAALEAEDATPNFSIPVYPAYLTQKDGFELKPEMKVTPQSPPVCLVHAHDDRITPAGSALLYLEYKKLNLPAELHIYVKGGHGYGMKKSGQPVNSWPDRVGEWMKSSGLLD